MIKMERPYQLNKIDIGCEVTGIKLTENLSKDLVDLIKKDVLEQRILVFRKQEHITPAIHLAVGRWFGNIESTFYDHPASPHRDIFRVSNDQTEGCTQAGRSGWHIDGSFTEIPHSHAIYHIINVPTASGTIFAPLTEIIEGVETKKKLLWERLWFIADRKDGHIHFSKAALPESTSALIHPLVYNHPDTGKPVLCFHLGMTEGFILDHDKACRRELTEAENTQVLEDLNHEFAKNGGSIQYKHKYEPGDFIITDNLAVGHLASPGTQRPREEIGLRVMHRVTVAGKGRPTKLRPIGA